jgi:hypothetical protein
MGGWVMSAAAVVSGGLRGLYWNSGYFRVRAYA